jgi:Serine/threonine protein kinase
LLTKKQQKVDLRVVCDACGLPRTTSSGNSLTSWIFGKSSCHCSSPEGATRIVETKEGCNPTGDQRPDQQPEGDENSVDGIDISERFETLSILGSGGMGTVYKVKDKSLEQIFALKVLRPELAGDREAVQRFKQEIEAAHKLSHANLVNVYDYGISKDGAPYFVMDFVEGESLADIMSRELNMNFRRIIGLLVQVCDALSHAHENGIVHRDLKPTNILVTTTGDFGTELVKIVDFGIAKILPPPGKDTASLTKTAEIFGSPAYMSPEQCKGERVDHRGDIYSLGCVMFEMLIGQPPFIRENPVKTILAHIYDTPPPVALKLLGLENRHDIEAVINACLAKEPSERYDSIDQLAQDLALLAEGKDPKIRQRITKKKMQRQLKFAGFKYFPLTLIALCAVLITLAVGDLPWVLTLTELRQRDFFTAVTSEQLADRLVEQADDYNRPFAYLMAAESDLERQDIEDAETKTKKAIKIFAERKDYTSALMATRFLFRLALIKSDPDTASDIALKSIPLRAETINSPKRKGLRLIGWFYLPAFPYGKSPNDIYSHMIDELCDRKCYDQALELVNSLLASSEQLKPATSTTREKDRLLWSFIKASILYDADRKEEARLITDEVIASQNKLNTFIGSSLPLSCLADNDISRALQLLEVPDESTALQYLSKRWMLTGLCHSLSSRDDLAVPLYRRAIPYRDITASEEIALQLLSSNRQDFIDTFYKNLEFTIDSYNDPALIKKTIPNLKEVSDSTITSEAQGEYRAKVMSQHASILSYTDRKQEALALRRKVDVWLQGAPYNAYRNLKSGLARGYLIDGDPQSAVRLFETFVAEGKASNLYSVADEQLNLAAAVALTGNYAKADSLCAEVLNSNDPRDEDSYAYALLCRGNCYALAGKFDLARQYYDLAIKTEGTKRGAWSADECLALSTRMHLSALYFQAKDWNKFFGVLDPHTIVTANAPESLKLKCINFLINIGKINQLFAPEPGLLKEQDALVKWQMTREKSFRDFYKTLSDRTKSGDILLDIKPLPNETSLTEKK